MTVYNYGNPDADIVLIQPVDSHVIPLLEKEVEEIKKLTEKDFYFVAYQVENWNKDLSPWCAQAVFGVEDFGGGADETLRYILKLCSNGNKKYIIGGYSLAALFAIWASYESDTFAGVAAASPSVWFEGFTDYIKERKINASAVYLSLGDKEEKTKNPVMSTVGKCIAEVKDIIGNQASDVVFEWNSGNHFKNPDVRTAKGFAWVINQI